MPVVGRFARMRENRIGCLVRNHVPLGLREAKDYPDIDKMRILADVAPYSREYQKWSSIVRRKAQDDPDLRAEYERISEQVKQTKESTLQVAQRHFNAPVDKIEGTVKHADANGVELAEYPGRVFRFSSVGSSMADLTRFLSRRAHVFPVRAGGETGTPPGGIACLFQQAVPVAGLAVLAGLRAALYIDGIRIQERWAAATFPSQPAVQAGSALTAWRS